MVQLLEAAGTTQVRQLRSAYHQPPSHAEPVASMSSFHGPAAEQDLIRAQAHLPALR